MYYVKNTSCFNNFNDLKNIFQINYTTYLKYLVQKKFRNECGIFDDEAGD